MNHTRYFGVRLEVSSSFSMNFCNQFLQQRLHELHINHLTFNLQQNDFIFCCNRYTKYTKIMKARNMSWRNWKQIWYGFLKQQLHELHEKIWAWLEISVCIFVFNFCSNGYTNYTKIIWLLSFRKMLSFSDATDTRTTQKSSDF